MFKTHPMLLALSMTFAWVTLTDTASAQDREIVAYRLTNWKTVHFDDAKRADVHAQTVKRLGCEVKTGEHGGHIDVSYQCPQWREISLDSHTKAHNWESWLKASGFETRHEH